MGLVRNVSMAAVLLASGGGVVAHHPLVPIEQATFANEPKEIKELRTQLHSLNEEIQKDTSDKSVMHVMLLASEGKDFLKSYTRKNRSSENRKEEFSLLKSMVHTAHRLVEREIKNRKSPDDPIMFNDLSHLASKIEVNVMGILSGQYSDLSLSEK